MDARLLLLFSFCEECILVSDSYAVEQPDETCRKVDKAVENLTLKKIQGLGPF
jgi:hypothetical protein